jgi:hypothetical protein
MRIIIQQVQPKTASGDYDEFYAFRDSMVELLESLDSQPVEPARPRPTLIEIMAVLCVT